MASWSEVVAVPAGSLHTVGIRRNGSVLACGKPAAGRAVTRLAHG
ncbi:RCC1 domain-containing protein [Micrococcus sp. 2A]